MSASGKYRGIARVKAVLSGDTVVLVGAPTNQNEMKEKLLVLSGIEAPKIKSDISLTSNAFKSRDFLRRLLIGKMVDFFVSHSTENLSFGNIILDEENIAALVVANGWAKVKPPKGRPTSDRVWLMDIEQTAKDAKLGIWKEDSNQHVRTVEVHNNNLENFFKLSKGKVLKGVVERVIDGSAIKVELRNVDKSGDGPVHHTALLRLAGVQCPRIPTNYSVLYERYMVEKEDNPDLEPPEEEMPQPIALLARLFTELRILNRDVEVRIVTHDKSGHVFANVRSEEGHIASALVKNGLARVLDWCSGDDHDLLVAARGLAQQAQIGVWRDWKEEKTEDMGEFIGTVVQIVTGDSLVVVDNTDVELRIYLSSIRSPKMPTRVQRGDPLGPEAKEYLRKLLIGKKVKVVVEYIRRSKDGRDRVHASVFASGGKTNVALELVRKGYASVVNHRMDDERSLYYDSLLEAEEISIRKKVGMHSKKVPVATKITDLTYRPSKGKKKEKRADDDVAAETTDEDEGLSKILIKARQYEPFLKKRKKVGGIVEYCFTGNRLKVHIPSENCIIGLVLSGVRCPMPSRADRNGEPLGDEALLFTKKKCLQHDVQVEIDRLDERGSFLGSLFVGKRNLAVMLLKAGYAKVYGKGADRSRYREELWDAQEDAKNSRIGVWLNYVEKKEEDVQDAEEGDEEKEIENSQIEISITELTGPVSFHYQIAGNNGKYHYKHCTKSSDMSVISDALADYESVEADPFDPQRSMIYAAKFVDGNWYRCRVLRNAPDNCLEVEFIDFGNQDVVPKTYFKHIPAELAQLPPCSNKGTLACLKATKGVSDDCLALLGASVWDKVVKADVHFVDRGTKLHHVTLYNLENEEANINQQLIRDGLARVMSRPVRQLRDLAKKLRADEKYAQRKRHGMWRYGDISSDEEGDNP